MSEPSETQIGTVAAGPKREHGISLWQRAWRELRKNIAAMTSLIILLLIGILAAITPMLPLQSPIDKDVEYRKLLAPTFETFHIGERKEFGFPNNSLVEARAAYGKTYAKKRKEILTRISAAKAKESAAKQADYKDEKTATAATEKAATQTQAAERALNELAAAHPYQKLWHEPGAFTRAMIDIRLAIFGDWAMPSIFGTDQLGRDVLARVFWGARVSLIVGIIATLVSLAIGVAFGSIAGFLGGAVDNMMMRFVDVLYSIPFIFVVILLITFLREETIRRDYLDPYGIKQIYLFYFCIGIFFWLTMARVVRGQVMSIKNELYIEAARTVGARTPRIIMAHIIPNVLGVVIVYLTLTIPAVMLFEAFLSFLGLGVEPPNVSWGLLVNEGLAAITPIRIYWWLVLFPGVALAVTLLCLNLLGDGLRDALDPQLQGR